MLCSHSVLPDCTDERCVTGLERSLLVRTYVGMSVAGLSAMLSAMHQDENVDIDMFV